MIFFPEETEQFLEIIAPYAVVLRRAEILGRKEPCPLGVAVLRCPLEAYGVAMLVHRMALFVGLATSQVAGPVADGTGRGARVVRIAELLHEGAALAAIGFARKLAGDITPKTR
jgi:hypothetical protein